MIQLNNEEALRNAYTNAKPYPHLKIENFFDAEAAREIASSYPSFEEALNRGTTFKTVNERKKIQITDSKLFPKSILRLTSSLSSSEFLAKLSYISGIPNLIADDELVGGGMHITGPGGRLDVHVDFNYMEERQLHRRLNLLLYLNPVWDEGWGGQIQLWDENVERCEATFAPAFNRCVIFETSKTSYHGVTPVSSSAPTPRHSFAVYYYTREAPAGWSGVTNGTIFRARPEERMRRTVLMPAEKIKQRLELGVRSVKTSLKRLIRV
jgi:Rps23 Pro-64 3,4-dihydroxylase Tpa1-like proline 4-hydroxylase